jgi:hypothetical protein
MARTLAKLVENYDSKLTPPLAGGTYCLTIIGAHLACHVISSSSLVSGTPKQIAITDSSGWIVS